MSFQAPHDPALRPPPHDADAERGCLCAALTHDDLRRVVLDRLDVDAYHVYVHGAIHRAIRDIDASDRAVDAVTVAEHLRARGEDEDALPVLMGLLHPDTAPVYSKRRRKDVQRDDRACRRPPPRSEGRPT